MTQSNLLGKLIHYSPTKHAIENMANEADKALNDKIQCEQQCLHELLPKLKAYSHLRPKGNFWTTLNYKENLLYRDVF